MCGFFNKFKKLLFLSMLCYDVARDNSQVIFKEYGDNSS